MECTKPQEIKGEFGKPETDGIVQESPRLDFDDKYAMPLSGITGTKKSVSVEMKLTKVSKELLKLPELRIESE